MYVIMTRHLVQIAPTGKKPNHARNKADLAKESEAALVEQEKRLTAEAESKVATIKKEMGDEVAAAKMAQEEANALYAKENRGRKAIHNK